MGQTQQRDTTKGHFKITLKHLHKNYAKIYIKNIVHTQLLLRSNAIAPSAYQPHGREWSWPN